jgi:predicted short-subunit dehydrogenase-like oxidoreductase (DUF2520 family)
MLPRPRAPTGQHRNRSGWYHHSVKTMPVDSIYPPEVSIGIAGAGRIAQAIGRLLRERGQLVTAVASRNPEHTRAAAAFIGGDVRPIIYSELPAHAARLLIAVADDAIGEVAEAVARGGMRTGVALHTCGAKGPEALAPLAAQGVCCGTLHPLQTVPTPAQGVERLRGIAFAIAGDELATLWAEQLAALLGGQVLRIAPAARPIYHAAAVMASNYITGLIEAGIVLMRAAGVGEATARKALAPLIAASVEGAVTRGPIEALTGPIQRGDVETVAGHIEALASFPEPLQRLYCANGLQVLEMARRRGLPAAAAARLEQLLRGIGNANA